MFHVGQKVVCIDNSRGFDGLDKLLAVGAVYTIAHLRCGPFFNHHFEIVRGLGVQLCEVDLGRDEYFDSRRFRPLTERKTDISVFTEILDKHKDKVPA